MPLLRIEIHPEVYNELEQSRSWYENQAKGLGIEFLDEVDRAINLIRQAVTKLKDQKKDSSIGYSKRYI